MKILPMAQMPTASDRLVKKAQNLENMQTSKDESRLAKAATDFEAMFVNQMLKSMRDSVGESELIPKSHGEKMFQGMLDEEYSQLAAKGKSFGLGETIFRQFKANLKTNA